MTYIFIYFFQEMGMYIFDKPYIHPFRTPDFYNQVLAEPCNEPINKFKLKTMPSVGDTVWINTEAQKGFWGVIKGLQQ